MNVLSRLNLIRRYEHWPYTPLAGSAPSVAFATADRAQGFYIQCGQDKLITVRLLPGLRDGVLEGIGAHDGAACNNTIDIEEKLDWAAIAIKPLLEVSRVSRPKVLSLK